MQYSRVRYTRQRMRTSAWKWWGAAALSAGLLELPFPIAGPMPPWRSLIAFFGLVPLVWAVLKAAEGSHSLREGFLLGYVSGILWYAGNCYWIYDTMLIHGGVPAPASALLLVAFSLVLGAYFALFSLGVTSVHRRFGTGWALLAAPFLWVAQEFAGARITCVPWDQLGYSQVDNTVLTHLAPWTGVYGISFFLVGANALVAGGLLLRASRWRILSLLGGVSAVAMGVAGLLVHPAAYPANATAVLVQPNLDVAVENNWVGQDWNNHIAQFTRLAGEECKSYIAGIPQTGAPGGEIVCPPSLPHPDLVAWPEAPAPFVEADPRFERAMAGIAQTVKAPMIVGGIGAMYTDDGWQDYNSAMLVGADGKRIGRYDKIHLVPFGEYIPFKNLLGFAHKLTGRVSDFSRGTERSVFRIVDQNGKVRRYGIFICYEAVFADEVRHFADNGAQVLVNISDDGWYGDTSAPWQHLNMARMRAIENRRWLLRDTNNGVTAAIDPSGRVMQSIPRHRVDALPAQFGFCEDKTFYTAHGDLFAWLCAILSVAAVLFPAREAVRFKVQDKVRS